MVPAWVLVHPRACKVPPQGETFGANFWCPSHARDKFYQFFLCRLRIRLGHSGNASEHEARPKFPKLPPLYPV